MVIHAFTPKLSGDATILAVPWIKAMRLRGRTGAQAIVQVGMAFGIDPERQKPGDVLVSTSLVPYDNRAVRVRLTLGLAAPVEYRPRPEPSQLVAYRNDAPFSWFQGAAKAA
jgi:nucleoside phosphorylase